jgi:hypothetical protein
VCDPINPVVNPIPRLILVATLYARQYVSLNAQLCGSEHYFSPCHRTQVFEFILHERPPSLCVQLTFYCLSVKTTLEGGETEE